MARLINNLEAYAAISIAIEEGDYQEARRIVTAYGLDDNEPKRSDPKKLTIPKNDNHLNTLLYERMVEHGYSIESLAEELGLSCRTIELYLRGKTMPARKTLDKLMEILGFTLDDFYGGNLTEVRESKGYSTEDVAGEIGILLESCLKWESGEKIPTIKNYLRLREVLFDA